MAQESITIKPEDVRRIVEAILSGTEGDEQGLLKKDWPFLSLICIDLETDIKTLKEIKKSCQLGFITDVEAFTNILNDWITRAKNKATWDNLISVFTSNMAYFPGSAVKDYAGILKELAPKSELTNLDIVSRALQIDLIREELLKRLPLQSWKILRQVCRVWWTATLSDWRKTATVKIGNGQGEIRMEEYFNLFTQRNGEYSEEVYDLVKYPNQKFSLNEEAIQPPSSSWSPHEQFFWSFCAPNITHLNLNFCSFLENEFLNLFKWLVLSACPKLDTLNIIDCTDRVFNDDNPNRPRVMAFPEGAKANNLKTLNLTCQFPLYGTREYLELAPNVQNLSIEDIDLLDGLLNLPNPPPFPPKLTNLKISTRAITRYAKLKQYTERFPNSLKHLHIANINLSQRRGFRFPPFDFYSAISNCKALTSLQLQFFGYSPSQPWLMDLSTIHFPELTKLYLRFGGNYVQDIMRFDFGTLKNTPKLKSLTIHYSQMTPDEMEIVDGIGNWVYNGSRDMFMPEEKQDLARNYPETSEIYLEFLEEFKFDGWQLTDEDLELFKNWFPNVKRFTVTLDEDTISTALEVFPKLEFIYLTSASEVDREVMFEEKQSYEKVRIVQNVPNFGRVEVVKIGERMFLEPYQV